MDDQIPFYEVDEDTKRLLETVLELASLTSQVQLDVDNQQNVLNVIAQVCYRFDIEMKNVQVIELDELDELADDQLCVNNWPFDISVSCVEKNP